MVKKITILDIIVRILLIFGAINLGLSSLFEVNLIPSIFGILGGWLITTINVLIGASGIYEIIRWSME